ncbi:MAG: histidine kinase [Bacteroidota bacterium]
MRVISLLFCTCFLLLSLGAQSKEAPVRKKGRTSLIQRAQDLREKQPDQAIKYLTRAVEQKQSTTELIQAFTLLGDIYTDIEQYELAINRYDQALSLTDIKGDLTSRAELFQRRGTAFVRQQQLREAESSYQSCLSIIDSNSQVGLACQEGLADVATARNELELSQQIYQNVQLFDTSNNLRQSRVAAKRANNYAKIEDLSNANLQYQVAIEKLPKQEILATKDYEDVLAANLSLSEATKNNAAVEAAPPIAITPEKLPRPIFITDQLNQFERYKDQSPTLAEPYLAAAIAAIDTTVSSELSTQVYQTGANYYVQRAETDKAARIYQKFIAANNILLAEQQAALSQQADILKQQQAIDLVLKDQQLASRESSLMEQQLVLQRWLIFALGALLLGALLSVGIILRNVRKRRRANQELLLRSLQTQMNPHFIFNSLNSINNYIAKRDERSANRFLGRFAKLMRNVLDQSGKSFVPVLEEIEQLQLYLELEEQRFSGKFTYEIKANEPTEAVHELEIPPMLIQPFAENAIWHGLRYLPETGKLTIHFAYGREALTVTIRDNGIGRNKSLELKTENQRKHRSTGMKNTRQRIELINALHQSDISLQIGDAEPEADYPGTEVCLIFPY